jgi:Predicted phosphatase homologous to the C-terminal domain of histone macroH2A1
MDDITKIKDCDVIVNAASQDLRGGSGIDGAIHEAAGEDLLLECIILGRCDFGDVKITAGHKLPVKYIFHTVGPIYNHHGNLESRKLLSSCYTKCLEAANEKKVNSIAFPTISTGVHCYPKEKAANVGINSVVSFLKKNQTSLRLVLFIFFDTTNFEIYKEAIPSILSKEGL